MPVSAPLTTPQPNQGAHAQAALYASQAVDALKKAVGAMDPSSPLGQAILDAIKRLSKEVGNVPQDAQVNSIQSQLQAARRNQLAQQIQPQIMSRILQSVMGSMGGSPGMGGAPANANASSAAPAGAA